MMENSKDTGLAPRRHDHRPCQHDWQLRSDDVDEFGPVRMFECHKCGRAHFS